MTINKLEFLDLSLNPQNATLPRKPKPKPDAVELKAIELKYGTKIRQLLQIKDLCVMLSVCRTTIDRWLEKGQFPPPILMGGAIRRWRVEDIQDWLEECRKDGMEHYGSFYGDASDDSPGADGGGSHAPGPAGVQGPRGD